MKVVYNCKSRNWKITPYPNDYAVDSDFAIIWRMRDPQTGLFRIYAFNRNRQHFPDLATAIRETKKDMRVLGRANRVVYQSGQIVAFTKRMVSLPSAEKVRRALQSGAVRGLWRQFTQPTTLILQTHHERAAIMEWLEQRDLHLRVYFDIPFVSTRRLRRPIRVFTDVIDFRTPDEQFEFKVRWL